MKTQSLTRKMLQKEQANMLGTFTEAAEWIESVKGGYNFTDN